MRSERGFTLLEVIMVATFIIAFTVAGTIGLQQLQEVFKLHSAGDEIRSQFQLAREKAIAGVNQTAYKVILNNRVVSLQTQAGVEVKRYQAQPGIIFSPTSFTWSFAPVTGQVSGCVAPCTLVLSSGSSSETIKIDLSGIVE
jgi:type II secretory pathway component PulJ